MWRRATSLAWWLGVSVYFGGLLALGAIAAPAIRDSVEQAHITMPGFASPPLVMRAEVTGQIFGDVLGRFTLIEVIALGLMLIGVAGFLFAHKPIRRSAWVLLIIWTLLAAALAYDSGILRGQIYAARAKLWQTAPAHAAEGFDAKWPERTAFADLHAQAESLGRIKAYLLLAMILITACRGLADKPLEKKPAKKELMSEV